MSDSITKKLPPSASELYEALRLCLEQQLKTKIVSADSGSMRMYIALHKTQFNTKPKDKTITYLLLRIEELLLNVKSPPGVRECLVATYLCEQVARFTGTELSFRFDQITL